MTQIDFYTHVDDKLKTACQLAGKAFARGLKVTVFCPDPEAAQRFDRMLWTTPAIGFVPHCAPDDPLAAETPVIVDCRGEQPAARRGAAQPAPGVAAVLQPLPAADRDRQPRRAATAPDARERFRFYRDRGYEIRTHDLSKTQ